LSTEAAISLNGKGDDVMKETVIGGCEVDGRVRHDVFFQRISERRVLMRQIGVKG
jgi:hypothetical protein